MAANMPGDEVSAGVLQGITRHINCLNDENRNVRKKALEGIRKETTTRDPRLGSEEMDGIFAVICKPLLKIFSDSVEKCRTLSISIVSEYLDILSQPESHLSYILPIMVQRLGQPEMVEMSEETRLTLVGMLTHLIELTGNKVALYLDDYIKILTNAIVDPYSEVRKESCKCTSLLSRTIPQYFHMQSETLIPPLMSTMTHQHSRVRTIVVDAVGDVLQYGSSKCMDVVVPHLAQRLFDQSPPVRLAVTKVVGNWLLDLHDRYSFFHKLMPLLLTSVRDEQPDIREVAAALWHDVGMKYGAENENDLKDKMDFAMKDPVHYPPNCERPNLGCRQLMFRNVSKILPGLVRDLGDWVPATRAKSSSLLPSLLLNAEEYMTQHLELILSGLYKACGDEEKEVVANGQEAAELMGYFVKPDIWTSLLFTALRMSPSPPTLTVLAAIIKGSERSLLQPHLTSIADVLVGEDICHSAQWTMQQQLLNCVCRLCDVSQDDVTVIGQQMFTVVMTTAALRDQEFTPLTGEVLDQLYKAEGLSSEADLFTKHTESLLRSFDGSYETWNSHCVESVVFDTLLMYAGPVIGDLLDLIIPIFTMNLNPEKDATVRLRFFTLLSRLLLQTDDTLNSQQRFSEFSVTVIRDMVIPNCVWKAGRTAGAIRTTAVSCLWTLLQSGLLTKEQVSEVMEELMTQLTSCLQDDNKSTRLISCRVMTRIFDLVGSSLDRDRLHDLYPELLKRLDDSSDEIRLTVANTFLAYLTCFNGEYNADLYVAHLEAIYRGLLVHLDDPDNAIQEAVCGVLKEAAVIRPSLLLQEVEVVKHKHRTPRYCDRLVEAINNLHIDESSAS